MFSTISNNTTGTLPAFGSIDVSSKPLANVQTNDSVQFSGLFNRKTPEEKLEKKIEKIEKKISNNNSYDARKHALNLTGELPDEHPNKIGYLEQGLKDKNYSVRRIALEGVIKLTEDHPDKLRLIEKGMNDRESYVARAAFNYAFESDNEDLRLKAIKLALFYPNEDIKNLAIWHLSKLPDEQAEPILAKRAKILGVRKPSDDDPFSGLLD